MHTTALNIATICCAGAISFLAGAGGADIVTDFRKDPEPYGLQLVSLEYKEGAFHQTLSPINARILKADWSAQILRGNYPLCGGGGTAPYNGSLKVMDPNTWTDDDCPALEKGDLAVAAWTYKNVNGNIVTISGEVEIQ